MALSDELEALAKRHGATSYRNRADTQHPAYGFTEGGLNGLIDEVLAKWAAPQPSPAAQGDALESVDDAMPFPVARQVLKVARARLEGKP